MGRGGVGSIQLYDYTSGRSFPVPQNDQAFLLSSNWLKGTGTHLIHKYIDMEYGPFGFILQNEIRLNTILESNY